MSDDNQQINPCGCPEPCVYNEPNGPVYIPKFQSTYVGNAKERFPPQILNYGPECGACGSICEGRCRMVCNTIPQAVQKYEVLRHNSNYIGTSKRMAYGKYANNTPGLYTFASKKVPSLQPTVKKAQVCFTTYWCKSM
jgi:hypothetical protein